MAQNDHADKYIHLSKAIFAQTVTLVTVTGVVAVTVKVFFLLLCFHLQFCFLMAQNDQVNEYIHLR